VVILSREALSRRCDVLGKAERFPGNKREKEIKKMHHQDDQDM
jgi:hypothetical protein